MVECAEIDRMDLGKYVEKMGLELEYRGWLE